MQVRDRIKSLRRIPAKQLRPHPLNWRTHPEEQQKAMRAALAEIGYADVLIVRQLDDGSYQLIDGHLRAETTPDQKVPAIVVDLDDAEARKLLATLDPLAALARADEERLQELAGLCDFQSADLQALVDSLAGVTEARTDGLTDPDDIPDVPEEPITKTGDLWLLGEHRLLCGDSTKASDLNRLMAGDVAALMATDPPYCVEYTGAERPQVRGAGKDWSHVYREVDIKDFGEFLRAVFTAVLPHLRDNAGIYVWHAHLQYPVIDRVFEELGLLRHQPIVWVKPTSTFTYAYYRWQHEPCIFGWKQGHKPPHYLDNAMTSVWEVDWEGKQRIVGNAHPTQKPTRLFEISMEQHTRRGEVVLEPFCGSGSQIIAAEKLGRRCRAMEIEPAFVDVAVKRWEDFTGKKAKRE